MLTLRQRLLFLLPLALVLLPFLIWPAAFGALASLSDYAPALPRAQFVGLGNYLSVLGDPQFRSAIGNIAVFTLASVPAEIALGFALACLLREPFRGRGLLRVVLLAPWLVSPIANGVMWHYLFNSSWGLINFWLAWAGLSLQPSPLGLHGLALPTTIAIEVWRDAPLAGFLLLPGLLAIPAEQWEQAVLDGVPLTGQIRHVAWPWLRPLLLAVSLLLIGDALGTFDTVLILTGGGPGTETLTPGLYSYQQAFQINNWPAGATSAWLIVAAVLLVGLVYLRLVRADTER